MTLDHVIYTIALIAASIACATDMRTGLIPNRLTLPLLVLAPLGHGLAEGAPGALESLIGLVLCGAIPLLFYRLDAMGGGDVKLFAALGAVAGPALGLEIELLSIGITALFALCTLAFRGQLAAFLLRAGRVALNLILPARRRWAIEPTELTSLRIGAAIFLGTVFAVVDHAVLGGGLL